MSLLDRFLEWVAHKAYTWRTARAARDIRKGVGERVFSGSLMGMSTFGWPGGWSQDRIEQVLHYKAWVHIAVRAICEEMAGQIPRVGFVRSKQPESKGASSPLLVRKSLGAIQEHEEVTPAPQHHPLCRLLARPNAWDTAGFADLIYELNLFLELTGNAYLWVVPNGLGLPQELWVMPSHWVWPRLGAEGISHYEVRPFVGPGTLKFPPGEIIHFKSKSPIHKLDGYSAQTAGAEWIDAAESVNRTRFFQFKNFAAPFGAIELDEKYGDPDDAALERIYAKFFARLQGESSYGKPIILPPGAKFNPLQIAPAEMAYVQSADQLRDWVLALFGVPKEIAGIQPLGSDLSWYAPMLQFCRFKIAPRCRYLGAVLTGSLAIRYDPSLRIWYDDPTPESPEQVNRDLALDATNGWVTPNEARALRGRAPYTLEDEERYARRVSPQATASGTPPAKQPEDASPAQRPTPLHHLVTTQGAVTATGAVAIQGTNGRHAHPASQEEGS